MDNREPVPPEERGEWERFADLAGRLFAAPAEEIREKQAEHEAKKQKLQGDKGKESG